MLLKPRPGCGWALSAGLSHLYDYIIYTHICNIHLHMYIYIYMCVLRMYLYLYNYIYIVIYIYVGVVQNTFSRTALNRSANRVATAVPQ